MTSVKGLSYNGIASGLKLPKFIEFLWSLSLFIYVVCSLTFISLSDLHFLATLSQMFFLGMSVLCIVLRFSMKFDAFVISRLLFVAVVIIGTFYSKSYGIYWETVYNFALSAVTCICVYNYVVSVEKFEFFLKSMMYAGLSLCIYLFTIYGFDMFTHAVDDEQYFRLGAEISNANNIGLITALGCYIAACFILCKKESVFSRIPEFLSFGICGVFSLLSASKKSIFIMLAIIGIIILKRDKYRNVLKKIRYIIFAVLLVAAFWYVLENVELFHTVKTRVDNFIAAMITGEASTVSDNERSYFITEGLRHFLDSPLIGQGTASSTYYFGMYSHCNYVEILMNYGIIGFVVFHYPYFILLKHCVDMYFFRNNKSKLLTFVFVTFAIILMLGVSMVFYFDRCVSLLFAALFAAKNFSEFAEKESTDDSENEVGGCKDEQITQVRKTF